MARGYEATTTHYWPHADPSREAATRDPARADHLAGGVERIGWKDVEDLRIDRREKGRKSGRMSDKDRRMTGRRETKEGRNV